jgi:hypothetical protein
MTEADVSAFIRPVQEHLAAITNFILIPRFEKIFATGKHPEVVLHCISCCFGANVPVPEWAQREFRRLHWEGQRGWLRSWDKAFGRPSTERKFYRSEGEAQWTRMITKRVAEAKQSGVAIDDELFEQIGLELRVGGKTRAKKLYRRGRNSLT